MNTINYEFKNHMHLRRSTNNKMYSVEQDRDICTKVTGMPKIGELYMVSDKILNRYPDCIWYTTIDDVVVSEKMFINKPLLLHGQRDLAKSTETIEKTIKLYTFLFFDFIYNNKTVSVSLMNDIPNEIIDLDLSKIFVKYS